MIKKRLRFEKTDRAKYISHLDLMRTFQHSFIRAGIAIKHTEGFNPHPYISIALPLSLGCESFCEVLDIELDAETPDIAGALNPWLPEGIKIISEAEPISKVGMIKYVRCRVSLVYDDARAADRVEALRALFASKPLVVQKKTKRGMADIDLAENISEVQVTSPADNIAQVEAVISAAEPTINPTNLADAVKNAGGELTPDFVSCARLEIYDKNMKIFK